MRSPFSLQIFVLLACVVGNAAVAQNLELQLSAEPVEAIAEAARVSGDALRGAVVFYQPTLGCTKCHRSEQPNQNLVGPVISGLGQEDKPTDVQLVEALLQPSKRIRKGFELQQVLTTAGTSVSGRILANTAETLSLLDAAGQKFDIPVAEIESQRQSPNSLMPTGQMNLLSTRQQFLDLVRYLMEVRDGGAQRELQLTPPTSAYALQIPEYEQQIDHARLIRAVDAKVIEQGAAIYRRVCANCHGTHDQAGSLPTSLRFAEGKFKNGSDPYAMYQTLTRGFGMMTPQTWMVPTQKYAVIHYIREAYLKSHNPSQWTEISDDYLQRLPQGDSVGPEPSKIERWNAMDYGNSLAHTYQVPGDRLNIAYKGIAIRLDPGPGGVSRGKQWMLFDTDTLRWAAGWSADGTEQNFIDWRGIQFNGEHQIHPRIVGQVAFANANGPGWANPENDSFADDQRVIGRDDRRYGPLPRPWGRFLGQYRWEDKTILHYQVGGTAIFESPTLLAEKPGEHETVFLRQLQIAPHTQPLNLKVLDVSEKSPAVRCGVKCDKARISMAETRKGIELQIPPNEQTLRVVIGYAVDARPQEKANETRISLDLDLANGTLRFDFDAMLKGTKAQWGQAIVTSLQPLDENASTAFGSDVLTLPDANPWLALVRPTGLDFLSDGRMVVCTWDGDVWTVRFVDEPNQPTKLIWHRIASGMFQPLGLKVVDDTIYVTCRDQLARLHDLNGDDETDYYECFNSDHQVTEHFHEFAMGLQRDEQGNFYYAKSARHALPALVPHHGTLLQVSPDGLSTKIVANGFRAANGVCLNPDGSFFVTDQEGHWNPKNRINWVRPSETDVPRFYGNMFGYTQVTDSADAAMEPPLCWITNAFDRSPGELLWVHSKHWGPLDGALLNLSYGMGKVFLVPYEKTAGLMQGGMIELPMSSLPTGVMRGRFSPFDEHLYACGMFAWAGNAQQPGGLYRIRPTGKPIHLPLTVRANADNLQLVFSSAIDPASISPANVSIKTWDLRRTANYGSKHFNEQDRAISRIELLADGKTVQLTVPSLGPTWCMEIRYRLRALNGQTFEGVINNTIHVTTP